MSVGVSVDVRSLVRKRVRGQPAILLVVEREFLAGGGGGGGGGGGRRRRHRGRGRGAVVAVVSSCEAYALSDLPPQNFSDSQNMVCFSCSHCPSVP